MNFARVYGTCLKINDIQVLAVGELLGEKRAEIFDLITKTWTLKPEFDVQTAFGNSRLTLAGERMIMLRGSGDHYSQPFLSNEVWEWDKHNGWVRNENDQPAMFGDWNGNQIPFFKEYNKPQC